MRNVLLFVMMAVSVMASAQNKITLTVGNRSMTATLADTDAARALLAMLERGSITVSMEDYGGFEKVGELPSALPTSNTRITTVPGDIMLYQGNNIVIFYGTNTWSYTPLGHVDGATADNLRQFLGSGSISLALSAGDSAGVDDICIPSESAAAADDVVYDLNGRRVDARPLSPGLYLINGRKTLVSAR